MSDVGVAPKGVNWWAVALWTAQVLLALAYGAAGTAKLITPIADLAAQMSFVADWPTWSVRTIGALEVLGALGMILPVLTRILPALTPLAALGFSIIQVLAIIVHGAYGELAQALPVNLVFLALSLFVMWGRWKKVPVAARS